MVKWSVKDLDLGDGWMCISLILLANNTALDIFYWAIPSHQNSA